MFPVIACAWQAAVAERLTAPPVFRTFTPEHGLPSSQIQALGEDASGRLWIGTTNGLASYDGHAFKSYVARLERPNALATGSVEALLVDAAGRLWVATQGGHLARYRPQTDDFERITIAAPVPEEIWALAEHRGNVWLGTYGAGLVELDAAGQVRSRFGTQAGLPSANIVDLYPAHGKLWIATFERQLVRFDPDAGRADVLAPGSQATPFEPIGLGSHGSQVWVSTRDGRRCRIGADGQSECAAVPLLALPGRTRLLLASARGDFSGGIGELLREQGTRVQHVRHSPGSIGGVPNHSFWVGLADRDDGLWLGTTGGGLLHLPREADQFQVWQADALRARGLLDGRVRGLARMPGGELYIGSMNAGLFRLDPRSGEVVAVATPGLAVATPRLASTRIWALLSDAPEQLWIGHQDGLSRFSIDATGQLVAGKHWGETELTGGRVDLLQRDHDGNLWAASMGQGLSRLDPAGRVHNYLFGEHGLAGTEIQQLLETREHALWVASDKGLFAYARDCDCFHALIEGDRVDAVAEGLEDRVHVFVDGQLVAYRWRAGLFRDSDVAPRSFDEFQTVGSMHWSADALWMAGPQGLYRFSPVEQRLSAFDVRDGLATRELSDRPLHQDPSGRLWVGSEAGVLSFDPRDFVAPPPPPSLHFAALSVGGSDGRRRLDPSHPAQLEFTDRDLEVGVRLATLARPHAQRFSFYLQGWDSDPPEAGAALERRFGALAAGSYVLEVRAWDGYGQTAANTLRWPFVVAPPWWRERGAFVVYALLAVVTLLTLALIRQKRRQAADVLEAARRKAEFAESLAREKSALVAELSHEIRNPLNGLLGMGRLLAASGLDARQRRFAELLSDAGAQLTRLLDDVLDWSRIEAGFAPLPSAPVHLASALAGSFQRHAELAAAKGLAFTLEADPELVAEATLARLIQVVDNLLGNAIKFTASGSIDVCARVDPADPGKAMIEVCDSGPGFSDAERAALFRPFERGKGERAAPGTGLGLAISRALAERMGGSLVAEPSQVCGARLVLRLSRVLAPADTAESQSVQTRSGPTDTRLDGLRVLMVEDDPIGREVLEAQLRDWGVAVSAESNAMDALIRLQGATFDAVLLDWDLPGMSGLELGKLLRSQHGRSGPALIAVTGRASPEDLQLGRDAGFDAHVAKPVVPLELNRVLARVRAAL